MTNKLEILRQRAQVLARIESPESDEIQAKSGLEVVEFEIAGQHFALETMFLGEAISPREITPLPGTPAWTCGLVNVRSQILAVVDLRPFFGLTGNVGGNSENSGANDSNASHGARESILLVQSKSAHFGIVIDALHGTRFVPLDALQSASGLLAGGRAEWIRGVTEERLVLLDGARILEDKALLVNDGF